MAVSGKLYLGFLQKLVQGAHDFDNDAYKVALLSSGYTPSQDTHFVFTDVSGYEIANGNGYSSGGASLTLSTGFDTTNEIIPVTALDTTWNTLTATFRYAVVYKVTGSYLVGYLDFGIDQTTVAENYTIIWNTSGIFDLTTA